MATDALRAIELYGAEEPYREGEGSGKARLPELLAKAADVLLERPDLSLDAIGESRTMDTMEEKLSTCPSDRQWM